MIPNTELELTLQEVIKICSKVRLADKTLTFDSFGSNDLRISTEAFLDKHGFDVFDGETKASIHKMSAKYLNRSNNNGWDYFWCEYNGEFVTIDSLRYLAKEKGGVL